MRVQDNNKSEEQEMVAEYRKASGIDMTYHLLVEFGPFGERATEINFTFYPAGNDESLDDEVEIICGEFYANGRIIDLDREVANNVAYDIDDLCIAHARKERGER